MVKYIVSLASDWDEERGYLWSTLVDTTEQAHTILNMKKSLCEKRFLPEEEFTLEEFDDSYICYVGTKDYPEPSCGWEKCIITKVEL